MKDSRKKSRSRSRSRNNSCSGEDDERNRSVCSISAGELDNEMNYSDEEKPKEAKFNVFRKKLKKNKKAKF